MKIKWDIEHVYFYLVCFIALILIIVGAVKLTQTAIAYVVPVYEDHSPFYQGWQDPNLAHWREMFGQELLDAEKERYEVIAKENYRRGLIRDLVSGLAYITASLPLYLYHWRKVQSLERVAAG